MCTIRRAFRLRRRAFKRRMARCRTTRRSGGYRMVPRKRVRRRRNQAPTPSILVTDDQDPFFVDAMAWSSRAIQGEAADRLFRARRRRIFVLNMRRLRRYRNDKPRHMEIHWSFVILAVASILVSCVRLVMTEPRLERLYQNGQ